MIENVHQSPLYQMVNPSSIAFFGASGNPNAMGSLQLRVLVEGGYRGDLYPVHPREASIEGFKVYRSVLQLPVVPELAVLVLPTKAVAGVLDECGRKGIRRAIVVSGGFRESGGEGARMQDELRAVAHYHGIRFLGPNCIGTANPHAGLNTTIFPYEASAGFIGMASQSGSFVTQMFNYLGRHRLGFSTAFSVGNEADVDLVDCLEYLGACPKTRVIGLYIEGIRRGNAFLEAARAVSARKPVVALYVGGSDAGRRAGLSHTAALAGPDQLYDGLFRQAGMIRVHSVTELFDVCWAFGHLPLPQGKKVVIQTHSGGPGAAAADACAREGLDLPPLGTVTCQRLERYAPATASLNNPLDLTFSKDPAHYFEEIPDILLEDPGAQMLLVYLLVPGHMIESSLAQLGFPPEEIPSVGNMWIQSRCERLAGLVKRSGKPLVGYTFRSLEEDFIRGLIERGIPVYGDPSRAARVLSALSRYGRFKRLGAGGDSSCARYQDVTGPSTAC